MDYILHLIMAECFSDGHKSILLILSVKKTDCIFPGVKKCICLNFSFSYYYGYDFASKKGKPGSMKNGLYLFEHSQFWRGWRYSKILIFFRFYLLFEKIT